MGRKARKTRWRALNIGEYLHQVWVWMEAGRSTCFRRTRGTGAVVERGGDGWMERSNVGQKTDQGRSGR